MKTITLTLSTYDAKKIKNALSYNALALETESYNPQHSRDVQRMFARGAAAYRDVLCDISKQCKKQEEQEDAE